MAELGGNIRWGVTTNLTMNGTVNPDFSQVEADAARIPIDLRFAIFFPEKRPFFVEGIEQLSSPGQLIYTRRVTNPVGAVKLTGKAAGTTIGLLSAVDAKNASETLVDNPIYNLVRLRRDLAGQSTVGLTYTDKIDGRDFNRVAAFDARIVFKKLYFIQIQAGQSFTRRLGSIASGPIWDLWADRTGRSWGFRYQVKGFQPRLRGRERVRSPGGVRQCRRFEPVLALRTTGRRLRELDGEGELQRLVGLPSVLRWAETH